MTKLLALTSCVATACMSTPDNDTIELAVRAATAGDASTVAIMSAAVSGRDAPAGCPRIATAGDDTTATGPCTTGDGGAWDGSLITHNVRELTAPQADPTLPSHAAIAHRFTQGGVAVSLDGTVEWNQVARTIDAALTVSAPTGTSVVEIHYACDVDLVCTAHDSRVEVDDLGAFAIAGTWRFDGADGSRLVLEGDDTIVLESNAGRVDYRRADGTSGTVSGTTNMRVFLEPFQP